MKENKEIALVVEKFSKTYDRFYKTNKEYVVKDINFVVKSGSFHGFIGANGAGKTTVIKSLIGAYADWRGNISVFGHKNTSKNAKKRLGYIPEAAYFPKDLTAVQYITHMANIAGLSFSKAKKYANETLDEVGLGPIKRRNPNSFSSGQKKKVLLAQALVSNPDVVIMDEPAANLDPKARIEFFNTLQDLKSKGKAIFISSHILAELGEYVDSVTILDAGKVVYTGAVEDMQENSKLTYELHFNDVKSFKIFKDWISKSKLRTRDISAKKLYVDLLNYKNLDAVYDFIAKNKLRPISFIEYKKTLQELYDEFVNFGSVSTKGKDLKERREKNV